MYDSVANGNLELYKEADDRRYETKHFFRKSIEDNV